MCELERALVVSRARYERWLGTEPQEIEAAAERLSSLHPGHSLLPELEQRWSRARQIKRMLATAVCRTEHLVGREL
jgi:hypothetical protein